MEPTSNSKYGYPSQPSSPMTTPPKSRAGLWIIVGIIIVIGIVALVYIATQKSLQPANLNPNDNVPINQQPQSQMPAYTPTAPTTPPVAPVSVTPKITGLDVINLQTFPYQVQIRVKGTVPDTCAQFDVPSIVQKGKVFTVTVTASESGAGPCTNVVTSQNVLADLPVSGLAAGTYTVKLGKITKTFTLASNNSIDYTGDK